MLVPAGVLVLLALGSIAVDSAIAFGAQRELTNQAAAAVNDALTLSLTDAELQKGADAQIDESFVENYVRARLTGAQDFGLVVEASDIEVQADAATGTVVVVAEGTAPYIFSKALPGANDAATVRATAEAELQRSDAG